MEQNKYLILISAFSVLAILHEFLKFLGKPTKQQKVFLVKNEFIFI